MLLVCSVLLASTFSSVTPDKQVNYDGFSGKVGIAVIQGDLLIMTSEKILIKIL